MNPQPIKQETKTNQRTNFSEYKKMGFGLVLMAGVAALLILVAYPLYSNYQSNTLLITQEKTKISELDLRLSQLDKIKRIAESIKTTTDLATQAIPEDDEIPVVMAMVQEISKNSGVKISDFSYAGMESSKPAAAPATGTGAVSNAQPEATGSVLTNTQPSTSPANTQKESFDIFKMQLTVKGKFDDIKRLISNLENSRRILDVQSFTYSIQTSETQLVGDVITLKLTLASYFKKFESVTSSVDIDKYNEIIKKLQSLTFITIDLSNPNVGKIDPFSSTATPTPAVSGTPAPGVNNVEPSSFYNQDNSSEVNVVELEGTGKTVTPSTEPDVEAEQGDTTKLLQDLIKQEGL